jgi:hypothetical protein
MAESLESPENLESPGSLTAALPALPQDASVDMTQATIVDLTGNYPLPLAHLTETIFCTFVLEKLLLTHAQDLHRLDPHTTTANHQAELEALEGQETARSVDEFASMKCGSGRSRPTNKAAYSRPGLADLYSCQYVTVLS